VGEKGKTVKESSLLLAIPHFILAIALLTEPYLPILEDGTLVQTQLYSSPELAFYSL